MTGINKCSAVEKYQRERLITTKLIQGTPIHEVEQWIEEKWQLSRRQRQRYMSRISKQLQESNKEYLEKLKALQLARYEHLHKKCLDAKKFDTAEKCLDKMAQLQGMTPQNRMLNSGAMGALNVNINELKGDLKITKEGMKTIDDSIARALENNEFSDVQEAEEVE
jgi:hypothetical protein